MKAFICNGCFGCQFACKDEHVGNDWAPIAKPQPDSGQFWMRVDEYICGQVPQVRMHYIPNPCNHCDDAPCMKSCLVEGAMYKRDDGLVLIDTDLCTGCKACIGACPYDSRYVHPAGYVDKCTFCLHRIQAGKLPACVGVCPTFCLHFGDLSDPQSDVARMLRERKWKVLHPETGCEPNVYFLT